MNSANDKATYSGDGTYYPRTSSVARCIRDMVFHRHGEPWTDKPQGDWGNQFRFNQGHDAETRIVNAINNSEMHVACQQMEVTATTPAGLAVKGHMDGIIMIPESLPHGGKWYVFDVKSAGSYVYKKVFHEEEDNPDN
jgi:hypothetical protein